MVMLFQCLSSKIQKFQDFLSSVFQQQVLPKMVSSSTDLHHKVADIKDINFAGMVKVHTGAFYTASIWFASVEVKQPKMILQKILDFIS